MSLPTISMSKRCGLSKTRCSSSPAASWLSLTTAGFSIASPLICSRSKAIRRSDSSRATIRSTKPTRRSGWAKKAPARTGYATKRSCRSVNDAICRDSFGASRHCATPASLNPDGDDEPGLPRKLALENRADLSWIGFALGCGHRLADKGVERFFLPRLIFGDDRGIRGEHVVDDSLNGAGIGDLLQTLDGDDRIGVATVFAGPHRVENFFGDTS